MEKVRAEISSKEREDEQEMEKVVTQAPKEKKEEQDPEEKMQFKTKMGRNIYRSLFKAKTSERNELFLPGRMAYVVDLEDEFADSDIPCTVIRSKADCPSLEVKSSCSLSIIVCRLFQAFTYFLTNGHKTQFFYATHMPQDNGGVLWFHVGCPCLSISHMSVGILFPDDE